MDIAVIGCGYVGLVSGTCLASLGHRVTAVDVDATRVAKLREGIVPIYEPGLEELIKKEVAESRLNFDTDTAKATRDAQTIFLAVGTPPAKEGGYDFSYLFSAAEAVAKAANGPKTIVIKSTVSPGTGSQVAAIVAKHAKFPIEVVNNPEFLREGTAIQDFMQPDRIVFGAGNDGGLNVLREIYQPLIDKGYQIFCMSRESAELTKFSANAMLALRISFVNEISQLAQAVGADIESVRIGIGADARIGPSFLKAGVGYGGSCFPKDVQALVHQMKGLGIDPLLLSGIESANTRQKQWFAKRIVDMIKSSGAANPVVAVWGLAFKPDTDDIREAPAFEIIRTLVESGALVRTFDPQAMEHSKKALAWAGNKVTFCESVAEATQGVDAIALVTEWNEFITQDWKKIAKIMRGKHIFDGRNCLGSKKVSDAGLYYHAVGRPELKPGEGKTGTVGFVTAGQYNPRMNTAPLAVLNNAPVLVTGGAGFIGSHLTRRLLDLGTKVAVLDNFSNGSRQNLAEVADRITVFEGDIRNYEDCQKAAAGCTYIFHLAALGSVPRSVEEPRLYNEVNIGGTLNVLEAARHVGATRIVYSASSSAYGDTPVLPKIESMTPAPKSPYAVTKLVGEHYARVYAGVYGLSTFCLRYFNVFGPRQNPNSQYAAVIPAFITALLQGRRPRIYGDGEQTRDFCYIDNVVNANLLAATADRPLTGESANIACGQRISLNAMLARMQTLLGTTIEPDYLPARKGDVKDSLADITAARELIGYQPQVLFEEGLARTVAAYRAVG